MKIAEEKSKGWFQDTAIVFSSSYKTGEFEDQICKCRWWRTVATKSKSLKEIQVFFLKQNTYNLFTWEMIFLSCLISWSHFCSCEIQPIGRTHKITQMEEFCFAYLKWEMCIPCAIAKLSRRPRTTEPEWHEKRSTNHFSARQWKADATYFFGLFQHIA